jgi:nucleoid DNA-binding protein
MAATDCIERLAGLLVLDEGAAGSLLARFSAAMSAELLERGSVAVRGLGSFRISYSPPLREASESGWVYTAPSNAVLHSRRAGRDQTRDLLRTRLQMDESNLKRTSRAMHKVFSGALDRNEAIILPGFGRFTAEAHGHAVFRLEPGLLQIINSDYQDLPSIGMATPLKQRRFASVAGVAALALVCFAAVLFTVRSAMVPDLPGLPAGVFPPAERQLPVPQPAPAPVSAVVPDEVLLGEGEFTIVLATFMRQRTAETEQVRLDSAGVKAVVWPARQDGRDYWRLRTGRYRFRSEAVEAMRGLPPRIAGGAYIQKVIKRVVSHGEKEL